MNTKIESCNHVKLLLLTFDILDLLVLLGNKFTNILIYFNCGRTLCIEFDTTSLNNALYRFKVSAFLCPLICITVAIGTPLFNSIVIAVFLLLCQLTTSDNFLYSSFILPSEYCVVILTFLSNFRILNASFSNFDPLASEMKGNL